MDRQNVGGSASGQQSNFVARGAAMAQQKWNLDGVDITDMSATGGSPVYFDFDAFEEMQISTGGADVVDAVARRRRQPRDQERHRQVQGLGRFYVTDDAFQSNNVTDELRKQGVHTGNPIQNIKDYGIEVGGPIVKGRAWFWGSYGRQDINVGINNFYKTDADLPGDEGRPAELLARGDPDLPEPGHDDPEQLQRSSSRGSSFTNNQFSFFFNGAEKVRNARDASDLRPLETTYRQMGVTRTRSGVELVEDRHAEDLQVERPPHLQRPVHGRGVRTRTSATTSR